MLYLASTSPRRSALLAAAGWDVTAVVPGPEPVGSGSPRDRAAERARVKAHQARVDGPAGGVLGADTVVALGDDELGKPHDRDDAARMLRALSGRTHVVYTAVCVREHAPLHGGDRCAEAVAEARVRCRELTTEDLERWLATGAWRGKAGAYGLQDPEQDFMQLVSGARDTVVGLPIAVVGDLLARLRGGEA